MSGEVTRTAGVPGSFPVTFSQTPVSPPTVTAYSDPARTVLALASAAMLPTANPQVWTAAYPATLPAGRYYLVVSAVYTAGQPAALDADDTLLLTSPTADLATGAVSLEDVKAALNKGSSTVDDAEISRLIIAASAEYAVYVGPLPGPVTYTTPSRAVLVLRSSTVSNVVVADSAGLPVPATVTGPGIVTLGYGARAGLLTVSYTAGPVPAHHREAIIADIAELWTRTQRGGGSARPSFGGGSAGEFDDTSVGRPLVLFPRIRSLRGVRVG